jgi:hypothetical protein
MENPPTTKMRCPNHGEPLVYTEDFDGEHCFECIESGCRITLFLPIKPPAPATHVEPESQS